jgi:hypothetical protein
VSKANLSPTMRQCVEFMRLNGNAIHRHPGGFWAGLSWRLHEGPHFGTSTVHALTLRGFAQYTEHQDGRSGRFPITAVLVKP